LFESIALGRSAVFRASRSKKSNADVQWSLRSNAYEPCVQVTFVSEPEPISVTPL